MNLDLFPFDEQKCKIYLKCTDFYLHDVIVEEYRRGFHYFQPKSDEWEIVSIRDHPDNFTGYNLDKAADGSWDYANAYETQWVAAGFEVDITLHRRSAYYIYNIIAPVIMMSIIGFVALALPEVSGDKYYLLLTVLLGFLLLQDIIATLIPRSEKTPNLANFVLYALILAGFNLAAASVIEGICLHPNVKMTPPKWMQFIILMCLGTLVVDKLIIKKIKSALERKKRRGRTISQCAMARAANNSPQGSTSNESSSIEEEKPTWHDVARVMNRWFLAIYIGASAFIMIHCLSPFYGRGS